MEMPPVSKQTPLPTKATGWAFGSAAPFHWMTASWLSRTEPWPTPSSEPMPSLRHLGSSPRISTSRPSALQRLHAPRELVRVKHVGGFGDQVAGEAHAVGDGGLLGARRRGRRPGRRSPMRTVSTDGFTSGFSLVRYRSKR